MSTEQLREAREIVEQWRRPSLRDDEWQAEMNQKLGDIDPPRPPASDTKLERLERTLLKWISAAAAASSPRAR